MLEAPTTPSMRLEAGLPSMDLVPISPFPPGESPFPIKGTIYVGLLSFAGQETEGGSSALVEQLTDPALKKFFQRQFLVGSWYDFFPMLPFHAVAAAACKCSISEFVAKHADWEATRHASGLYKLLLTASSPETVAQRLGVAWKQVFGFGNVEIASTASDAVELVVSGLPVQLVNWYKVSPHAVAARLLTLAGARNVQSWYSAPEPDGERAGVALVRFHVRRAWTE